MGSWRRFAAALALVALFVLSPALPAAAHGPVVAYRLVLERTGGFAGRHDTYVVDRAVHGAARPLGLAGSVGFRRLHASYIPKNPCCDRFSYRLTVRYRGAPDKTVSAVGGAPAPRVLWDVIEITQRIGRAYHPTGTPATP